MRRKKASTSTETEVLYKSDYKCARCQKEPGSIHHINGNKNDNGEKNLIFLCLSCHDLAESKSPLSKRLTPSALRKYKKEWEKIVKARRVALKNPPEEARLIKFDGKDTKTVYLEVGDGVLRPFQNGLTLDLMGYEWGNIDILLEKDKVSYDMGEPLSKPTQCKKIRLRFSNGAKAPEIYLIWDDGKKHHIPDPETLDVIGGPKDIKDVNYLEFNSIPRGKRLRSIFDHRNKKLFRQALKEKLEEK